jgi:hypothetical protein
VPGNTSIRTVAGEHLAPTELKSGRYTAAALVGMLVTVPAQAHHSFAAYDMTRTLTQPCTVKEFDWFNPHTFIVAVAPDDKGKNKEYRFEGAPPAVLLGSGWTRDVLHYGDHIAVEYHPLKNGRPGGTYIGVTLADGKHLEARGAFFFGANSPEKPPSAGAPSKTPAPSQHPDGSMSP